MLKCELTGNEVSYLSAVLLVDLPVEVKQQARTLKALNHLMNALKKRWESFLFVVLVNKIRALKALT